MYAATFHPRALEAMIADVFERHVEGADPFAIETLWRRISARGYSGRPDLSLVGRPERDRDGVLGHRRQGGRQAGVRAPRWASARAAPRVHLSLSRSPTTPSTSTRIPISPRSAPRRTSPRDSPRSSSTRSARTRRSTRASRASRRSTRTESYVARVREAVGDRCDLLVGTHGQLTPAGAIRLARRLERFDPLWFEEPVPPDSPEQMADGRARHLDSDRDGRAPDHEARVRARSRRRVRRRSCSRIWDASAACSRRRRSRAWPRRTTRRSRRTSTAVPWSAPRTSSSPPAARTSSCSRGSVAGTASTPRSSRRPIRWEDGFVIPPTEPGLGVELDEDVALAHPYDGDELHLTPAGAPSWGDARRLRRRRSARRAISPRVSCAPASRSTVHDLDRGRGRRRSRRAERAGPSRIAELASDADVVITCLPSPAPSPRSSRPTTASSRRSRGAARGST